MSRSRGVLLLIEDESELRAMLAEGLAELGVVVCAAADGREALEKAAPIAGQIVVVLSDYSMPGKNGIELIADLRLAGVAAPVVLLSGQDHADEAYAAGASACIAKPCTVSRIRTVISEILQSATLSE